MLFKGRGKKRWGKRERWPVRRGEDLEMPTSVYVAEARWSEHNSSPL